MTLFNELSEKDKIIRALQAQIKELQTHYQQNVGEQTGRNREIEIE